MFLESLAAELDVDVQDDGTYTGSHQGYPKNRDVRWEVHRSALPDGRASDSMTMSRLADSFEEGFLVDGFDAELPGLVQF